MPAVELPLTVIERRSGWQLINFREVWKYKELCYFLAWRDVTVRYKQTTLGIAWVVLQPLATMLVFSLFLGRLAGISSDGLPYPVFVLVGLLPWTFLSTAIVSAGQSVVASQNLVTKVYFPRLLVPVGSVAASLVDLMIGGVLLLATVLVFGIVPQAAIVAAPLIAIGLLCTALGVGILFAAVTVKYRDFRHVVGFLIQLWMFATPSIYMNVDYQVSASARLLLAVNPAHGLIVSLRSIFFGGQLDISGLAISVCASVALLVLGTVYFCHMEKHFADIV